MVNGLLGGDFGTSELLINVTATEGSKPKLRKLENITEHYLRDRFNINFLRSTKKNSIFTNVYFLYSIHLN